MKKTEKFADKSVYQHGAKYNSLKPRLNHFLQEELAKGNLLGFPKNDVNSMVVLDKLQAPQKYFMIYDIQLNQLVRKFDKENLS